MWDTISAIIGIFIGIIIALIFGWVSYKTRFFVFTYCANDIIRHCKQDDYYSTPGEQLAAGGDLDRMLFINDKDHLFWHRGVENLCIPGRKQDVRIKYPQYCSFTTDNGVKVEARNESFESPYYTSTSKYGDNYINILAQENCKPQSSTGPYVFTDGSPELKWDEDI